MIRSAICSKSFELARRPVENMAISTRGTVMATAPANSATAVVLPNRRGVRHSTCCCNVSHPSRSMMAAMSAALPSCRYRKRLHALMNASWNLICVRDLRRPSFELSVSRISFRYRSPVSLGAACSRRCCRRRTCAACVSVRLRTAMRFMTGRCA